MSPAVAVVPLELMSSLRDSNVASCGGKRLDERGGEKNEEMRSDRERR